MTSEQKREDRLRKSHERAVYAATYEGKAIISPETESRLNMACFAVPGVLSLVAAFFVQKFLTLPVWLAIAIVVFTFGLTFVTALMFNARFYVVDESLEQDSMTMFMERHRNVRDTFFKRNP